LPRRLRIGLFVILTVACAAFVAASGARPRPAAALDCGPTNSSSETNSKLQIFVSGPRAADITWAFYISPNPYTLVGSLRVVDDRSPDLNDGKGDILLEDVCTTEQGETYTVSVDPDLDPECDLVEDSITRSAPPPTEEGDDPETAAFYFETDCPRATRTPTRTPTATPTPTPTTTPSPLRLELSVNPANLACPGNGIVTVTARQGNGPVPDGTSILLTTSYGSLAQSGGGTVGGIFSTTITTLASNQSVVGSVAATMGGLVSQAPFTVAGCVIETLSIPPITPPSTGDGALR
jgi:hypothetical protein